MKKQNKLLVQDAAGKIYLIPEENLIPYEIEEDVAKDIINKDSRKSQQGKLKKLGAITQLKGSELPNFRLLMQLEYSQKPEA